MTGFLWMCIYWNIGCALVVHRGVWVAREMVWGPNDNFGMFLVEALGFVLLWPLWFRKK